MMDPWLAAAALLGGYLLGSVSFARVIIRLRDPGAAHQKVRREVEGSDSDFEGHSVSATSVGDLYGSRMGCLTAFLDIAKGVLAVGVTLALLPDGDYHLLAGLGAVTGHNRPIYHQFDGGTGMSTVMGAFLVLDWTGLVVTQLVAMGLGIAIGRVLVLRWSGIVLMIPWLWLAVGLPEGLFALGANLLFWTSMWPELRQALRFQSEGTLPDEQTIAELLQMGGFWRRVEPWSIPAVLRRLRSTG
jgi:glycerol-3-phosphate acyltransferase PlsY